MQNIALFNQKLETTKYSRNAKCCTFQSTTWKNYITISRTHIIAGVGVKRIPVTLEWIKVLLISHEIALRLKYISRVVFGIIAGSGLTNSYGDHILTSNTKKERSLYTFSKIETVSNQKPLQMNQPWEQDGLNCFWGKRWDISTAPLPLGGWWHRKALDAVEIHLLASWLAQLDPLMRYVGGRWTGRWWRNLFRTVIFVFNRGVGCACPTNAQGGRDVPLPPPFPVYGISKGCVKKETPYPVSLSGTNCPHKFKSHQHCPNPQLTLMLLSYVLGYINVLF